MKYSKCFRHVSAILSAMEDIDYKVYIKTVHLALNSTVGKKLFVRNFMLVLYFGIPRWGSELLPMSCLPA